MQTLHIVDHARVFLGDLVGYAFRDRGDAIHASRDGGYRIGHAFNLIIAEDVVDGDFCLPIHQERRAFAVVKRALREQANFVDGLECVGDGSEQTRAALHVGDHRFATGRREIVKAHKGHHLHVGVPVPPIPNQIIQHFQLLGLHHATGDFPNVFACFLRRVDQKLRAIAEPFFGHIFVYPFLALQGDDQGEIKQLGEGIRVGDDVVHRAHLHQLYLVRQAPLLRRRTAFFDLVAGADDVGHVAIGESVSELIQFLHSDFFTFLGNLGFLRAARCASILVRRGGAAGGNQQRQTCGNSAESKSE